MCRLPRTTAGQRTRCCSVSLTTLTCDVTVYITECSTNCMPSSNQQRHAVLLKCSREESLHVRSSSGHGCPQAWGRGALVLSPWKCCKDCFVTVKRSVDQLFKHYVHNFWSVGVVHLVVLACVLSLATTKKGRQLFCRKKCRPTPQKILATAYESAHPWKKSCEHPWSS